MKKFMVMVAALGALYYFKPGLFPTFGSKGAFDSHGKPLVWVFTAASCNDSCTSAVNVLNERGIPFQEMKLDENKQNIDRYENQGGDGIIPYTVMGNQKIRGYNKGTMVSALVTTFGEQSLTRMERVFFANHFGQDGRPIIYIYGATWCGYCKQLLAELEKQQIPYTEIDLDTTADRAVIEDTMQISGYPTTYVGYEKIPGSKDMISVAAEAKAKLKTAGKRRT